MTLATYLSCSPHLLCSRTLRTFIRRIRPPWIAYAGTGQHLASVVECAAPWRNLRYAFISLSVSAQDMGLVLSGARNLLFQWGIGA